MNNNMFIPRAHHQTYQNTQKLLRENNHKLTHGTQNSYHDGGLIPISASPPLSASTAPRDAARNTITVSTERKVDIRHSPRDTQPPTPNLFHPGEEDSNTRSNFGGSTPGPCSLSGSLNALSTLELCSPNLVAPSCDPLFGPSPPPSPQKTKVFKVEDDQSTLLLDASPFTYDGILLNNERDMPPARILEADTAINSFMRTLRRQLDNVSIAVFHSLGVKSEQDLDFLCSLDPDDWYTMGVAAKKLSVKEMEWLHIETGLRSRRQRMSAPHISSQTRHVSTLLATNSCDVWTFLHNLRKPLTEHYSAFRDIGICYAVDLDALADPKHQDRIRETAQLEAIKVLDWFYIRDGLQERARRRKLADC